MGSEVLDRSWKGCITGACWESHSKAEDISVSLAARSTKLVSRIVLVPLVTTILVTEAFVFFHRVLPRLVERSIATGGALCAAGVFLLFNLLLSYRLAVCTDPGLPPRNFALNGSIVLQQQQQQQQQQEQHSQGAGNDELLGHQAACCKKCGHMKPPRAHHCRICGRCVLKMDHHCPWINNCVGLCNHRYFCLFLLYLGASCLFVSLVFPMAANLDGDVEEDSLARASLETLELLCWAIAVVGLVLSTFMGVFHFFLVLTNQTTIEFQANSSARWSAWLRWQPWRHNYDLGLWCNLKQVFGPCGLSWLLPFVANPLCGDGLDFPTSTEI